MSDVIEEMAQRVCTHYSAEYMREELRRQVEPIGVMAWCRLHRIEHHAPVSLALKGEREVGPDAAVALGFFKVTPPTFYVKHEG